MKPNIIIPKTNSSYNLIKSTLKDLMKYRDCIIRQCKEYSLQLQPPQYDLVGNNIDRERVLKTYDNDLEKIQQRIAYDADIAKFVCANIKVIENYKQIECKYTANSKTKEGLYYRPLDYSLFHRWFSSKCTTIDLDFIEYRGEDIKLIYDVKGSSETPEGMLLSRRGKSTLKKWGIYKKVADKFEVPFWIIFYTKDMSLFRIYQIITLEPLKYNLMLKTASEFKQTIEDI